MSSDRFALLTMDLDGMKAKLDQATGESARLATALEASEAKVEAQSVSLEAQSVSLEAQSVSLEVAEAKVEAGIVRERDLLASHTVRACPVFALLPCLRLPCLCWLNPLWPNPLWLDVRDSTRP